jgi:hypothetical protein
VKKFKEIFESFIKRTFTEDDFLTLSTASMEGDIKTIEKLFKKKKIKSHHGYSLTSMFNTICEKGYLNIVQYLLTSPDTKDSFHNIHIRDSYWIKKVCENGHFDVAKYLFSSKELTHHAQVHTDDDIAFIASCNCLNKDLIKFFAASKHLKKHANIHAQNDTAFINLCNDYYEFNVMTYSSNRKYMKIMFERYFPGNKANNLADKNLIMEIIEYFIFELNIPQTKNIDDYLNYKANDKDKDDFKKEIKLKFDKRDFHNSLQDELVINDDKKPTRRIKL